MNLSDSEEEEEELSVIIAINNPLKEIINYKNNDEDEIDPFASERGEDSEAELIEDEPYENCEEDVREDTSKDKDKYISHEDHPTDSNVKIFIPMVSSDAFYLNLQTPLTIDRLLETLKIDHPEVLDSKGNFIGAFYWRNLKIKDQDRSVILEGFDCERDLIVLVHNLMKEIEIEELVENVAAVDNPNNNNKKSEKASASTTNKSLMSRFKNLWNGKAQQGTTSDSVLVPLVFGVPLEDLKRSGDLPEFVSDVLEYLNDPNRVQEGLFRLSGTFTKILGLQDKLNSGESLASLKLGGSECHNVTSLLKQFLRNLPEPLMTFELYEAWQELGKWMEHSLIAIKIARFLVKRLPKLNGDVLTSLMAFLHERLADSEVTRMNACNYGTVIGPNLLWHPQEDRNTRDSTTLGLSLQSSTLASQVCTLFLRQYDDIFKDEGIPDIVAYGKILYDYSASVSREDSDTDGIRDEVPVTCSIRTTDEVSHSHSCSDIDGDSSDNNVSNNLSLTEGQIIFITGIDDSFDGWWLGYTSSKSNNPANKHRLIPERFPSNYVQVLRQCADAEFLNKSG